MRLLIVVYLALTWPAGIRRVRGAKRLGVHVGNWLTAEQGKRLLLEVDDTSLRGNVTTPRSQFCWVADFVGRN
jgi:hypothetical protein